jgi:hypothetical protein
MREINNEIESVLEGIIAKKMQAMQEGESTECDLLSLMLEPNMGKIDGDGRSVAGITIEDVLFSIDRDATNTARMDNDPTEYAPRVAGPCKGGGPWPIREEPT